MVVENVFEKEGFMCCLLKDVIWYGKNWIYDECLVKIEELLLMNLGLSEFEQFMFLFGFG